MSVRKKCLFMKDVMPPSIQRTLSLQIASVLIWFCCGHSALAQDSVPTATNGEVSGAKKNDIRTLCPKYAYPLFPRAAINANIAGTVIAEARIADGKVQSVRFISGPDVYYDSVRKAMLQYECVATVGDVYSTQEFRFQFEPNKGARPPAGPAMSYAAKVSAAVKANLSFSEELPGNPACEVEVRLAGDGQIVDMQLLNSSGFPTWDSATMTALKKTDRLPLDADGKVPPRMILSFRPK